MRKIALFLLPLLVLAACETENENHYTIQRLSSVEEFNADGTSKTVKEYSYFNGGYSVRTSRDGVLQETSCFTYTEFQDIQTDSAVVEGVLKPSEVVTTYYRDPERRQIDSILAVNAAGEQTLRELFSYDSGSCIVVSYQDTVKTSKRVISYYYGNTTAEFYTYDTELDDWKYLNREDTVTSSDYDLTTVTVYVDNKAREKTTYQTRDKTIEFWRYTADDSSAWTMVAYGTYYYEVITI